jgi:hypothetical protein
MRTLGALLIALLIAGCTNVEGTQADPANHRRDVWASGYSLDECQSRMNELAGASVQMTGHVSQVGMSILNFGMLPPYTCHGIAAMPVSSQPSTTPAVQ